MSVPNASRWLLGVQEQLSELMLEEQMAKTEKAKHEAERARLELEAVRSFVREHPNSSVPS